MFSIFASLPTEPCHDGIAFLLQHYNVELKDNSVDLTEEGVALMEMVLETNDLWDEKDPWARCLS